MKHHIVTHLAQDKADSNRMWLLRYRSCSLSFWHQFLLTSVIHQLNVYSHICSVVNRGKLVTEIINELLEQSILIFAWPILVRKFQTVLKAWRFYFQTEHHMKSNRTIKFRHTLSDDFRLQQTPLKPHQTTSDPIRPCQTVSFLSRFSRNHFTPH